MTVTAGENIGDLDIRCKTDDDNKRVCKPGEDEYQLSLCGTTQCGEAIALVTDASLVDFQKGLDECK